MENLILIKDQKVFQNVQHSVLKKNQIVLSLYSNTQKNIVNSYTFISQFMYFSCLIVGQT
jgi:hypothetical protein